MKFIKFTLLFFALILLTGLIPIKDHNAPLSKKELEYIFPDDNFRKIVSDYFPNEEITISKLNNLQGEFYASSVNIKDLTGISTLKNIDSFVFWNDNLSYLPPEIEQLNNVKSINLANNFLTDDDVINNLINKGIHVDYDLNFINNKDNQYELRSKVTNLNLYKNEKVNLRNLLYKDIENYSKYWEVTKKIPAKCHLYIESNSPPNLSVNSEKGTAKAGTKKGVYYIIISLTKYKLPRSTVIIKTTVK